MRVYLDLPQPSRGLQRVKDALIKYTPAHVDITANRNDADLVILHVIGRNDQVRLAAAVACAAGQRYAVIQYALRSTMRPHTSAWLDIWHGARVVWSYYDLPQLCAVDSEPARFEFYDRGLGADAAVFIRPMRARRTYLAAALGPAWLTESIREVAVASSLVGKCAFHVGPDLGRNEEEIFSWGYVSDQRLAELLGQAKFVSGLRRVEGFELPAAEGLLCGARPILFDRAHYRRWFGEFAEYIPEGNRDEVIAALVNLFRDEPYRPVTPKERARAAAYFDWQPIIAGFWERALS